MAFKSIGKLDCSVAQTLGVVGEWWTLLILRNAFQGMRRFEEFQRSLNVSTSLLSRRLRSLTEAGVLAKIIDPDDARSAEYRLTEQGLDLYPILVALMDWGEKWRPNGRGRRMELTDRSTGEPILGARVLAADGRVLGPRDVWVETGPGADQDMHDLIGRRG